MRLRLPRGYAIEIDSFAVVLAALTVIGLVAFNVSYALTEDFDAVLVGWGSNALVAAMTGYVIFRITGGSLSAAPRIARGAIKTYFWVGALFLVAAITTELEGEGGVAAFHLAATSIAPGVVVSSVVGMLSFVAGGNSKKTAHE